MTFLRPLLDPHAPPHRLANVRSGRIVAERVIVAFDSASRRKGLLGRDSMPEASALILAPTNAIHTFFMQFGIDIAFVTRSGCVLKVCQALPPWRMAGALWAHAAIELPAGALARADTRAGDRLVLVSAV